MSDLDQLLQERAVLDAKIDELQFHARLEAITKANEILREHGITVKAPAQPGRKRKMQVVAKFKDPASGKTWSGRGRKPNWLHDAIAIAA